MNFLRVDKCIDSDFKHNSEFQTFPHLPVYEMGQHLIGWGERPVSGQEDIYVRWVHFTAGRAETLHQFLQRPCPDRSYFLSLPHEVGEGLRFLIVLKKTEKKGQSLNTPNTWVM